MDLPQGIWTDNNISGSRADLMHVYNWSVWEMCSIQCLSDCCRTCQSNTQQKSFQLRLFDLLAISACLPGSLSLDLPAGLYSCPYVCLSVACYMLSVSGDDKKKAGARRAGSGREKGSFCLSPSLSVCQSVCLAY